MPRRVARPVARQIRQEREIDMTDRVFTTGLLFWAVLALMVFATFTPVPIVV
jgi:hypothetical protein